MRIKKDLFYEELRILDNTGLLKRHTKKGVGPIFSQKRAKNEQDEHIEWDLYSPAVIKEWLYRELKIAEVAKPDPLVAYIYAGQLGRHLSPHPLIDPEFLTSQLRKDEILNGHTLLYSYLMLSNERKIEVSPSRWFIPKIYLKYNRDLGECDAENMFAHYIRIGAQERRPACMDFDPWKWEEKHRLKYHIPIVDFLIKNRLDSSVRPTRPNLPGGIVGISDEGDIRAWIGDTRCVVDSVVAVIGKKRIGWADLRCKYMMRRRLSSNRLEFDIHVGRHLSIIIETLASRGARSIYLETQDGDEIGPLEGWTPDEVTLKRLGKIAMTQSENDLDEISIKSGWKISDSEAEISCKINAMESDLIRFEKEWINKFI